MPDPNVYPSFPGFPQPGSQHAPTPRQVDPRAGRLHPAISRADQERHAGAGDRLAFGPPAGGWPFGSPPGMPGAAPASEPLSPLQQRVVDGLAALIDSFGGGGGPTVALALGAARALLESRIQNTPDEAVQADLERFERMIHDWRTGDGSDNTTARDTAPAAEPR